MSSSSMAHDICESGAPASHQLIKDVVPAPELADQRVPRRGLLVFLVLLVLLSCGGQEISGNQKVSDSARRPISANHAGADQLAGEWNLSLWLPSHGTVVANLHLDENGHGEYLVTATGLRRSGALRVTAWDGEWLEGKAAGVRKRMRATMKGNILYIELPVFGQVLLIRKSPQGGPVHFSGS